MMKPEIAECHYWLVSTIDGDTIVPRDVLCGSNHDMTRGFADPEKVFRDYLDTSAPITGYEAKYGFIARMSAPGYLDCTDWTAHPSYHAAALYLLEQYGDES